MTDIITNPELEDYYSREPILEYWPAIELLRGQVMAAEVVYCAGGPSSSNWIVPGTGDRY